MKKIFAVFLMMVLFLISGCGNDEDPSRYPFVRIPGYEDKDYYELLSQKRPEIVYNAVCYLITCAPGIGQTLSNQKVDKNSQDYIISLKMYKKILELLSLRDSKIQAASLKFLEQMSTRYGRKDELIAPILNLRSNNPNVQYEQVFALSMIAGKSSKIDKAAIKKFIQNRNWLVSRQAYFLVNQLEDEQLRTELIKKYNSTNIEFEKLLILSSLENNFSSQVFEFLTKEIASTQNQKIRHVIFDMLDAGKDKQKVPEWIDKNFGVFSEEDITYLENTYSQSISNDFSASLLIVLINHGVTPEEDFFKELDSSINELTGKKDKKPEDDEKLKNLMRLDRAISENASLKDTWLALKNKSAENERVNKEMEKEYNDAVDQFVLKSDEILKKYNVEDKDREEFLKSVSSLKEYQFEIGAKK